MQLPSGFPVKIEIPIFHVINARITFSNIQVNKIFSNLEYSMIIITSVSSNFFGEKKKKWKVL